MDRRVAGVWYRDGSHLQMEGAIQHGHHISTAIPQVFVSRLSELSGMNISRYVFDP